MPGAGKSTFIESLGSLITAQGKLVAVLTIDPSSKKSGGSILGDKTRMEKLSVNPHAFIRPSASNLSLGGVANHTRETILLCEAAGFDTIIIETVGVGQSETLVKGMTDFFLLLMLAGAGDELQGMKKGIMEMADVVAINKADGKNTDNAQLAVQEYASALHLLPIPASGFIPRVVSCSALTHIGVNHIWNLMLQQQQHTLANGYFKHNRRLQNLDWMHDIIKKELEARFYQSEVVQTNLSRYEESVSDGKEIPLSAAGELLNLFFESSKEVR